MGYLYSTIKIGKINLNLKALFFQYAAFFGTLALVIILQNLFLDNLNFLILKSLNLQFFRYFYFLHLGLFLLVFLSLIIIFKIFKKAEIEQLVKFFGEEKKVHQIIRRGLIILKKIIRD